jgi:hypothetical protein
MLRACEPFVRSRLFANNDTAVVCAELKRGDFGSTPAKGQTGEARRLLYRASLLSLVFGFWFLVLGFIPNPILFVRQALLCFFFY